MVIPSKQQQRSLLRKQYLSQEDIQQQIKLNKSSVESNLNLDSQRYRAPSYKFPQSKRFQDFKSIYSGQIIKFKSTLSKKYTTFGYNQKNIFSPKHIEKARTTPSPLTYRIQREFDGPYQKLSYQCLTQSDEISKIREQRQIKNTQPKRGKSFGYSFDKYQKVYLDHAPFVYQPQFTNDNPPVGHYQINQEIGKKKIKYSIQQRRHMFNDPIEKNFPGSNYYQVSDALQKSSKFRGISFGYGKKLDLAKPLNINPGPGSYGILRNNQNDKICSRLINKSAIN